MNTRKYEICIVRMNTKEKEDLRQLAKIVGVGMSEIVRNAITVYSKYVFDDRTVDIE